MENHKNEQDSSEKKNISRGYQNEPTPQRVPPTVDTPTDTSGQLADDAPRGISRLEEIADLFRQPDAPPPKISHAARGGLAPQDRLHRRKSPATPTRWVGQDDPPEDPKAGRQRPGKRSPTRSKEPARANRVPKPTGSTYEEWAEWAAAGITDRGDPLPVEDWSAKDLLVYFNDLVEHWMRDDRPIENRKAVDRACEMIDYVGPVKARAWADHLLRNWKRLARQLNIQASTPRIGILAGFADGVKDDLRGKKGNKNTGSHRASEGEQSHRATDQVRDAIGW